MAHQRYIDGKRVLHTRKLSAVLIEVTLQNDVPGAPRQRTVIKIDEYEKKVRQRSTLQESTCPTDHRKPSPTCLV